MNIRICRISSEPLFALKETGQGDVGVFNWTDNEKLVLMEVGVLGCLWCSDAPFGRCGPMRVLSVFRLSFPPFIRGDCFCYIFQWFC